MLELIYLIMVANNHGSQCRLVLAPIVTPGLVTCVVVRAILLPLSLIACLTVLLTVFVRLLTDFLEYTIINT